MEIKRWKLLFFLFIVFGFKGILEAGENKKLGENFLEEEIPAPCIALMRTPFGKGPFWDTISCPPIAQDWEEGPEEGKKTCSLYFPPHTSFYHQLIAINRFIINEKCFLVKVYTVE